jgi:hypothetical protein
MTQFKSKYQRNHFIFTECDSTFLFVVVFILALIFLSPIFLFDSALQLVFDLPHLIPVRVLVCALERHLAGAARLEVGRLEEGKDNAAANALGLVNSALWKRRVSICVAGRPVTTHFKH